MHNVQLDTKNSVNVKIIEGPIKGTKTIALKTIENAMMLTND